MKRPTLLNDIYNQCYLNDYPWWSCSCSAAALATASQQGCRNLATLETNYSQVWTEVEGGKPQNPTHQHGKRAVYSMGAKDG